MSPMFKDLSIRSLSLALLLAVPAAPAFARFDPAEMFHAMDTNDDEIVSRAEFVAHSLAHHPVDEAGAGLRFDVLAGLDGELTEDEYKAAMAVLNPRPNKQTADTAA